MTARAAEPPAPRVALTWTAPAGCPNAAHVEAEVERLLGASTTPSKAPLVVVATVREDPAGGLRVRLETPSTTGSGARELRAASCDALADATATILALMIDPTSVALPSPPPSAPPPTPPPSTPPPIAPPAPKQAAETPPTSPPVRPRFHVGAWGVADVRSLPGIGFALGGAFAVTLRSLRLELGATGLPKRTATIAARPSTGGEISLVAGSAAACYDFLPLGAFELSPCLGYELGQLHASGFGVTKPGDGNQLWSALRPGALVGWAPIPRAAILARVEVPVPFVRQSFVLENVGSVYRPGPLAGRLELGIELRF